MSTLFPTQEIGSLAKPPWLLKAYRSDIGDKELKEVERWGNLLGVESLDQLLELLGRDDLKDRKKELRDWASIIGIKFFESAGLDIIYDGEVRRVEMYEYPIRRIHGFKFHGLVRSFDNKYYRKAACVDEVGFKHAYHLDEFKFIKSRAKK
ncbi:MAG: hypothetical protein KAI64_03185, partial [Thermoplasmata archaeon]|nr:hypothetical protein [Thermoplasmata archaeon]